MSEPLAKGFTCKCGEEHKYPLYVYAHWNDILDFECGKCQRNYTIVNGRATLAKTKKRKLTGEPHDPN